MTHLVAIHVSEQTVISVIQEAVATEFDLSPQAVSELAAHLVPPAVIAAMRQPSTRNARPTNDGALPPPLPTARPRTLGEAAADAAAARRARPPSTITLTVPSAPKSTPPASTAAAGTAPKSTAPASTPPLLTPMDVARQRQLCLNSLKEDSHIPEVEAIGACQIRSSKEYYLCVYGLANDGQVDGNYAMNACFKNTSREFINCVYHAGKDMGRDKRPAVDGCLKTIK